MAEPAPSNAKNETKVQTNVEEFTDEKGEGSYKKFWFR